MRLPSWWGKANAVATSPIEVANLATTPAAPVPEAVQSEYDHSGLMRDDEPAATPTVQKETPKPVEPEVKKEEPVVTTPEPEAKQLPSHQLPKHPRSLVRRALEINPSLTMEQIQSASLEDLDDYVERGEQAMRQQAAQAKPAETPPVDEFAIPEEIRKQMWPELAQYIERLAKTTKEAKQKADSVDELRAAVRSREAESIADAVDDAFASLPESISKRLGTGRVSEITPAELQRRNAVLAAAGVDLTKRLPSPKRLAKMLADGATTIFGETPAPVPTVPAPASTNGYTSDANGAKRISEETWAKAGHAAPSNRVSAKEPKGDRAAIAAVAQKLKELGLNDDDDTSVEKSTVPE